MSPERATEDAWLLTRAISPLGRVRVASVDASGSVLNQYSRLWPTSSDAPPAAPWAVPLASSDGFHLIAFDFDAKHGHQAADEDAATLLQLLEIAAIPAVLCASGPSGGRHVWTATTEPLAPALVGTLARLAASLLSSLDIAPLRNSATGCVRPPGAPHRDGGRSTLLAGDLERLRTPTSGRAAFEQLTRLLADQVSGTAADTDAATPSTVRIDRQGHPYLPGARRALPTASLAALNTPAADLDASVLLNTVLLGAAASHWQFADVAALVPTAPGLEHIRSKRGTHRRHDRHPRDRAATLARQWRYAVRYVAEHPRRVGLDATFDERAGHLADVVRTLQEHADAAPGRWSIGGGPSDRRVLDCLHLWALGAVTPVLEADTRRIALACGIGRETARVALQRLAADGWIAQVREAAGVHGASWTIDPQNVLPRELEPTRAQAATRPEGAGAAERTALLLQLHQRLELATHDVFTGNHALSFAAGNLYSRLGAAPTPSTSAEHLQPRLLERLAQFGLIHIGNGGWTRTRAHRRDAAALALNVDGRLEDRCGRYQAERTAWSWWQAEHDWMCGPRMRRDPRARAEQTPLFQQAGSFRYPKHPRGPNGRANFHAARTAIRDGVLGSTVLSDAA